MAHSLSARKRVRQNADHRARNRWRLRALRTAMKEFLDKLVHGSVEEAKASYVKAATIVDRSAQKGVIHKKQASRRKSRMNARLKAKALAPKS
jgi:small subunit ribosomal protein S20